MIFREIPVVFNSLKQPDYIKPPVYCFPLIETTSL